MKKTQRLRALLEIGYFPSELPPPFNTRQLAIKRASVLTAWAAISNDYPRTVPEFFSIPRIGTSRRRLSIVNPIAQIYLSKIIADEWKVIRSHLRKSACAVEVPDIRPDGNRAVPMPEFELLSLRRTEISALYSHALQADISRFYGTLYTHAIPWALHTKAWCKANLNTPQYNAALGAILDKAVRKGQDNQTLGIPVGPDTSRIISEIVAVAIDEALQSSLGLQIGCGFRSVDDWHIGFENAGSAEEAVAVLSAACRDYELELNSDKTRLLNSQTSSDRIWPTELRSHQFSAFPDLQLKHIEHFAAKAFNFANLHPDDNVINFAVQRTRGVRICAGNWRAYENFLLRAVRLNKTVLPSVVAILVSYNSANFPVDALRVGRLIEDVIRESAPRAFHAEVAWCLFLAKALRIKLSKDVGLAVAALESGVCALLALDLETRDLFETALDKTLWLQSMTTAGLRTNMWLLAYEASLKGWLSGNPATFISLDPYFEVLRSRGISFYDVNKNITHIRKAKPKPRSPALAAFLLKHRDPGGGGGGDFSMF